MSERLLAGAADDLTELRDVGVPHLMESVTRTTNLMLGRLGEFVASGAVQELRIQLRSAIKEAGEGITAVIGREILMLNMRLGRLVPTPAPVRRPLEHELLNDRVGKVLLLHDTDRWYLGDFLRHAGWVSALADTGAHVDVASHPGYLPLFQTDDRVSTLLDVSRLATTTDVSRYDLVVQPGAFRPATFSTDVVRGLYPHNQGWVYTRYGSVIDGGPRDDLNYFRAALHRHGQTALPTARPLTLQLPDDELREIGATVRTVFGNDRPVIVYNPTASNPRTRQTTIPKEVENVISGAEHLVMLRAMREVMPAHNILIASALVPGDDANVARIRRLSGAFAADPQVWSVFDLRRPELTSLRGFSMLLASDAVVASTGTSTGTNTHLAATVGLPSFSVERAADEQIRANWGQRGVLPMGSLRWRNPSPLVGAVNVDWLHKSTADFERAAAAFAQHLAVQTDGAEVLFRDLPPARRLAGDLQEVLESGPPRVLVSKALELEAQVSGVEARTLYGDFAEELAVLRTERPEFASLGGFADLLDLPDQVLELESRLIRNVVRDSMLHKLAQGLAPRDAEPGAPINERLLRKVRANAPLTPAEIALLGVGDETALTGALRDRLSEHVRQRSAVAIQQGATFQVGWQHEVTVNESIVVKTLSTNDASEYLTDEYTMRAIRAALDSTGGQIPASLLIDDTVVSRRINMLVEPGGKTMSPILGGTAVTETTLPVGWVDEQFDDYLRLGEQGVFNFDVKFPDVGIDDYGVLQVADFSVVARLDQQPEQWPPPNLRTDVFHMGINELITNGRYLAEFANGQELQEHYLTQVERRIGIDLRPHLDDWEWGDHGNPQITPLAARLREVFLDRARNATPRPVFPLVDNASEGITFDYISERLLEDRA